MTILQTWRLAGDRRRLESGDRPPKPYDVTPNPSTDRMTRLRGAWTAPVVTPATDRMTRLRGTANFVISPPTEVAGLMPSGSVPRPTGANYVRYEDLFVTGDTLQQVVNKVTGNRILTLPPGLFLVSDFLNGFKNSVRIGSPAFGPNCRGIAGSGPDQTIIKIVAGSSTQQSYVDSLTGVTANPLFILSAAGGSNTSTLSGVEFSNFRLEGTLQGNNHAYGGLRLEYCTDPLVYNVLIIGTKGYANVPPGETMCLSLYRGSGCFINHVEIDGRRDGVRQSASPIGYNSTSGVTTNYTYVHHALSGGGGHAYWYCNDSTSLNCRSEYIGTGTGVTTGYCFNHEESTRITHTNPVAICDRVPSGTGPGNLHMSLNSNVSGLDCILTVINPTWDATPVGGGLFCVERWSSSIGQLSKPRVFRADGVTPLPFTAIGFP